MTALLRSGYVSGGLLEEAVMPAFKQDVANSGTSSGDEYWMYLALKEAMKAVGVSPPNPTVGCVFVKDGKVVAAGATLTYGSLHAEREAIRRAANPDELKGSTLYLTLEPCSHHGKQPPCVDALVAAGIQRCVVATEDPNPLVSGKGIAFLRRHGIEVTVGVMRNECLAWHYPFALSLRTGKTVIAAKWAQTIDGHLADDNGQSKWLSGSASRSYAHFLRQKYDAIMVGAGTVLHDQPSLTARDCPAPIHRQPVRLIFDPEGKLLQVGDDQWQPIAEKTLAPGSPIVYGVSYENWRKAAKDQARRFEALAEVIVCDDRTPLEYFLDQLSVRFYLNKPIQSILVEGGATVINELLRMGRIDVFHVFLVPAFLAGEHYRIGRHHEPHLRQRQQKITCKDMTRHRLLASQSIGNDVLMEFVPHDRHSWVFASHE